MLAGRQTDKQTGCSIGCGLKFLLFSSLTLKPLKFLPIYCSAHWIWLVQLSVLVLAALLEQEAQLSPTDRAMRLVSSNLASCHAKCRNYLYDKSWPNWWYEVGGLVGGNVSWTMCTQPWRGRVGSHCLRCHKQTDDGRIVYITCIPTTCCGEIF